MKTNNTEKIVIGIVGEIAAGKTTVKKHLAVNYNAVSFRFSDMLRDILHRLYLEETRSNLQQLSTMLRQTFGEDTMSLVIFKDVEIANAPLIITEGIRRTADITYLKQLPNFFIIAVHANAKIRYERITQRAENPDDKSKTWEQFQEEGEQETEQKIKKIAKQADFIVDNNGSIKELYSKIDKFMSKINLKSCKA